MPISGKEMLKKYYKAGWVLLRVKRSHYIVKKGISIESIPVHGNQDLTKGLENTLLKRLEKIK